MIYIGPNWFKGLLERLCSAINLGVFYSRQEEPRIIVGGIDKIYNKDDKVVIEGDDRTNLELDRLCQEVLSSGTESADNAKKFETLIKLGQNAGPTALGGYSHTLDVVVLNPSRLVQLMLAVRISMNAEDLIRRQGRDAFQSYLRHLSFPNTIAQIFAQWAFGNTQFSQDLREFYRALDFTHDSAKDGRFPIDELGNPGLLGREDAQECLEDPNEKLARLAYHSLKMFRLGIYDFENLASRLASYIIMPRVDGKTDMSGPEHAVGRLSWEVARLGPAEFLKFAKQKINEAYTVDKNVFELLK